MRNVLVIDGDPAAQRQLSEVLESDGCIVTGAANSREGTDRLEREHPDVVVLELETPGVGLEGMGRILERHPSLPIIVHTTSGYHRDDFRSWAAEAYLIKSRDGAELCSCIRALLARLPSLAVASA